MQAIKGDVMCNTPGGACGVVATMQSHSFYTNVDFGSVTVPLLLTSRQSSYATNPLFEHFIWNGKYPCLNRLSKTGWRPTLDGF